MKTSPLRLALVIGFLPSLSVFPSSARAQEKSPSNSPKPLTPEAALTLRSISDLQFSPDGKQLAFVVAEPPRGEGRSHHIWVMDTQSGAARQFTFSAKSETSPRWSPDGKSLAFLSNREEFNQIYSMPLNGGEAAAVTKGKRNIEKFAWSPDGRQLAYLAPDAKTEAEEKKEKDKDDARVADKETKRTRLWTLTLPTGETHALTPANWQVNEAEWLPAGDRLVISATDQPASDRDTNRVFSVSLADGVAKEIAAPRGPFRDIRVSASGKTISYVGCREDGPEPHDLMLLPVADGPARNLTGASLDRAIAQYLWRKDGGMLAVAAEGFRNTFADFTPEGFRQNLPSLATNPSAFAVASGGEIAFVGQTSTDPEEIWLWDQKSDPRRVSHFNDAWQQYALNRPEFYKYKSFDGLEIEAALLKPAGSDGKTKLPLVALIHGGPTGNWQDSAENFLWGHLLAARGYAVFMPNIRGSIGYGQKFVEMNRADWGGADFRDVMAGVDDLIARGIADPEKLGIGGWSYGGYLAEWAITQTTRFKAAVSGAGMANLISEFGTEEHPSYDEWFWSVPYEKPEGFLNASPFLYLKNAKTPTLILQGEADTIDPLGQSQELYRGLKRYGVEAEFVVYPREGHGLQEEKHLLDRLNRLLAWYDKHLKNQ